MVGGAGIVVEVLTRDKTREEKKKTPANRQLVLLNKHSNLGSCYYINVQGSTVFVFSWIHSLPPNDINDDDG